ncbi:hypothetical protein D3C80_882410 [compost metagenome]
MFEGIAERVVGAVVVLVVRVAQVLVVRNVAERHVNLGALDRAELTGHACIVAGELREKGQLGVFVDIPGQAWRDVVALVVDVVNLSAAVTQHAAQAVEELALIVDLAGAGEVDLAMVVAAVLQLDFIARLFAGAAADHVQQAAGRGLAVEGRRRATQQGDTVQVPGFDLGGGIHAFGQGQAIEELGRFKATYTKPVGPGVATVAAGGNTGHVAHRIIQAVDRAVVHLLASSDRNRARDFDQRGIGLGAGGRTRGNVALHRAPGTFHGFGGTYVRHRQRQGAFRYCGEGKGPCAALLQLQPCTFQCCLQSTHRIELPLHRCRSLAGSQRRVQGHGKTGLAGNLVQGGGQRTRRNVIAAHAGLFGCDQRAACQRGGQGDCQRQKAGAQKGFEWAGHTTAPGKINAQCLCAERKTKSDRGNRK